MFTALRRALRTLLPGVPGVPGVPGRSVDAPASGDRDAAPRQVEPPGETDADAQLTETLVMRLIVGLGNPGREYRDTRHNAGFMVLDRLAQRHGLSGVKHRFQSGVLEGRLGGEKCLLLQPQTYMNRSGRAVSEAMRFYKLSPQQVLVVVDDAALPIGRIRLRPSGSAGGHNGLTDIERALGGSDYPRLRIGIDSPPPRMKQRDYVLGRFTPDQAAALQPALDRACDCIEAWISQDIQAVMSQFNAGP